jgi:hypothetical protein
MIGGGSVIDGRVCAGPRRSRGRWPSVTRRIEEDRHSVCAFRRYDGLPFSVLRYQDHRCTDPIRHNPNAPSLHAGSLSYGRAPPRRAQRKFSTGISSEVGAGYWPWSTSITQRSPWSCSGRQRHAATLLGSGREETTNASGGMQNAGATARQALAFPVEVLWKLAPGRVSTGCRHLAVCRRCAPTSLNTHPEQDALGYQIQIRSTVA